MPRARLGRPGGVPRTFALRRVAAGVAAVVALSSCGAGGDDGDVSDGRSSTRAAATDGPEALPELFLSTTDEAAVDLATYVDAQLLVADHAQESELRVATEVRGRGNSTWTMPKKPYRLRLAEAVPLVGLPPDRDWVLLANYADKTLIRNRLATELGRWIGVPTSPQHVVVELHVNGSYEGVYDLYQHVEVDPDVIAIDELDPDADAGPKVLTGGYHLEVDHRLDEDACWTTTGGVPLCSKNPEFDPQEVRDPLHPSALQRAYIQDYLDRAEQAILTPGDSYEAFFDRDAMVNWFITSELFKNNDSKIVPFETDSPNFTSSVHLYKPRGGPLVMGPVWDFDLAAGNVDFNTNSQPTGWWVRDSAWHRPLFAHSSFGGHVRARWCELQRDGLTDVVRGQITTASAEIGPEAVTRNFERWPILGTYVWPNSFVGETHAAELTHLTTWMNARIQWIDDQLSAEFGPCPAS